MPESSERKRHKCVYGRRALLGRISLPVPRPCFQPAYLHQQTLLVFSSRGSGFPLSAVHLARTLQKRTPGFFLPPLLFG